MKREGVLSREEKVVAAAGKRFIANMRSAEFVVSMIGIADQPPCFCCAHKAGSTCPYVVGDPNCPSYVLYSDSPQKVERKLYDQINVVHAERVRLRASRQKLAA